MSVSMPRWVLAIAICIFVTGLCALPQASANGSEPSLPESYVRETFKAWVETNLKDAKVSGLNGYQYEFIFGDTNDGMVRLAWISERTRQQQLADIAQKPPEQKGDINGCPASVIAAGTGTSSLVPYGIGGAHIRWIHGEWAIELWGTCALRNAEERATRKASVVELARQLDVAIWGEAHDIDCSVVFLLDRDAFSSSARAAASLARQLTPRLVKLDAYNRTARAENKDLVEWAIMGFSAGKVVVVLDFTTVTHAGTFRLLPPEYMAGAQHQASPLVWGVTQALIHLRTRGRGKVGMLEIITGEFSPDTPVENLPEAMRDNATALRDREIAVKKLIQVLDHIGWWRLRGPGSTSGGDQADASPATMVPVALGSQDLVARQQMDVPVMPSGMLDPALKKKTRLPRSAPPPASAGSGVPAGTSPPPVARLALLPPWLPAVTGQGDGVVLGRPGETLEQALQRLEATINTSRMASTVSVLGGGAVPGSVTDQMLQSIVQASGGLYTRVPRLEDLGAALEQHLTALLQQAPDAGTQPAVTTPPGTTAPPTTTPPPAITGPSITNLRVSDQLTATGEVGPYKATFGSTTPKIWVACDYSGLQPGQVIRLLWTVPGAPEAIPWQTAVQTPAGRVSSWLNVPAGGRWTEGNYRLDVLLGTSLHPLAGLPFTIGAASVTPPAPQPVGQPPADAPIYDGTNVRLGAECFADQVISFDPVIYRGSPREQYLHAGNALGPPDSGGDLKPEQSMVSLGVGGSITLAFTDNVLTDGEGPDLWVFEGGGDNEPVLVAVSVGGQEWHSLGRLADGATGIDLRDHLQGSALQAQYRYVRITDNRQRPDGSYAAGADVDAVGAVSAGQAPQPTPTPTQPPVVVTPQPPAITGPGITNLRVSDQLTATGEIGPHKATFSSTVPKIWAALDYSGLQQGQVLRLLWTVPGAPHAIPWQTAVQTPAGRVSSWLNVPVEGRWREGNYRLDVVLGASLQPLAGLPFTIGTAAGPPPPAPHTPATTPSPDSVVKQAVLCEGVDEHNVPQGVSNNFPAGTEKVGLYLAIQDAPANTEITVEWSRGDRLLRRRLMVVAGNEKFLTYAYAALQQSMQAGNYVVEIKEDGRLVARLPFTIQ